MGSGPCETGRTRIAIAALLLSSMSGCGMMNAIAADTTASFLIEAGEGARGYFDYESAGAAASSGLVQLESLHRLRPENEELSLALAQAYTVYGFGWVMDEQEEASLNGHYEEADRQQARAYWMYQRAKDLVLGIARNRYPGIDDVLKHDPDELKAFLKEHVSDRESDTPILFWLAISWGSSITNSASLDALVDLPMVKVLALHSIELNENYEGAGALALLGGIESSIPEQMGGDWKKGRMYFERAIKLSKRRDQLHHINFARIYAVNAQDRALFESLVREVINAGDMGDEVRLSNKVARRRAERYLTHLDDLFP